MLEERFKKDGRSLRNWATEGDRKNFLGGSENPVKDSGNGVVV